MIYSKVLTQEGSESVDALELTDRDNIWLDGDMNHFIRSRSKKKPSLCKHPIFLDTETSHNHDDEDPKGWVYQFAFKFGSCYFVGRKPSELVEWLKWIAEKMYLNESKKVVIYIHNASYDLQYLKHYIRKETNTFKLLAMKSHKWLSLETDHFIFRCSYLLSNRSLDAWCKACKSFHIKATGSIDYKEIRYQDSELTSNDWIYQLSDVASMSDCWCVECGDQFNVQTIPLTSTGFVRHDGRKLFKQDLNNRKKFKRERLTVELYGIMRDAFMGGYTHGNRNYRGKIVKGRIKHFDYRSFYPSTTRCDYYPASPFSLFYKFKQNEKSDPTNDLNIMLNTKCCILTVLFENGTLDPSVTAPILSAHKVFAGRLGDIIKIEDNGRVLQFTGATVLHLTELDYKWIMKQYDFETVKILEMYTADRGYLPQWFSDLTDSYFLKKNTLKNVDELEYMKSKNKLNSIYGMTATALVRDEWVMDEFTGEWTINKQDPEESLDKYYNSKNSFMSYQYSLYVTAHCRDRLLSMIEEIGYNNFLYADTDSIFFKSNFAIENRINCINQYNYSDCLVRGAGIKDNKGRFIEYMTFEDEKDNITAFKFLHAKCYGIISDGELKITIAGVTSKWRDGSGRTREEELGSLDNLENGFTFHQCGGTSSHYTEELPSVEDIEGHPTELASACIIRDTDYTIKDIYEQWILDVNTIE